MYNYRRDEKRQESSIGERKLPYCFISSNTGKNGLCKCCTVCKLNNCGFKNYLVVIGGGV